MCAYTRCRLVWPTTESNAVHNESGTFISGCAPLIGITPVISSKFRGGERYNVGVLLNLDALNSDEGLQSRNSFGVDIQSEAVIPVLSPNLG